MRIAPPFLRRLLATGLLVGTAVPAAVHAAESVYRWVDENGVVNYSERPPAPGQGERIGRDRPMGVDPRRNAFLEPQRDTVSTPAVPSPTAPAPPNVQDDPRYAELEAERLARAEAIEEDRQRKCEQFRLAFDRLTATDRIRIQDADGNQRIIGEDERQGRIERAQEGIVRFCEP
jgi:hypothetical protein